MDLLALSEVRWGYFRTRKQFLLSRLPEPWRVFFAQPPGSAGDDPWTPRREGNVTTFTVPFLKPATAQPVYNAVAATGIGRALIERAASRHLAGMLERLGVSGEPVVMVSNIYAAHALERTKRSLTVYDFNDSPFQFSGSPRLAHQYLPRTLDRADRRRRTAGPRVRAGAGARAGAGSPAGRRVIPRVRRRERRDRASRGRAPDV